MKDKYAIIDGRMPESCKSTLIERGFEIIEMPHFSALGDAVSSHPDMLIFLGDSIYCHDDYYRIAKNEITLISKITGLDVKLSEEPTGDKYPTDILFNAVKLKSCILCKTDSVSELIKNYAKQNEISLVNVKQGYAKCSVCKVSENAIITSDKGIASAANDCGIDTLFVTPGHITLTGCNYGFIGGASGSDGNNTYFCGNIELHPDGDAIQKFCEAHGRPAVSLSTEPLFDVGTIFFI